MIARLAWRNIWRNKRRSLITMASVLFAVFFAVFLRSMQIGTYDNMIDNVVGAFSGHIQVHQKGYWEEQIIDKVMPQDSALLADIEQLDGVRNVHERLQNFALGAHGPLTKGVLVAGIQPDKEEHMLGLRKQLVAGTMIMEDEHGVLLSEGAATYLGIKPGDSLVLLSQGYHGASATGLYPVRGIVKLQSPLLNNNTVFMPLTTAQWFFATGESVTAMVVELENNTTTEEVAQYLQAAVDTADQYEVMDWKMMMPELVQAIEADSTGGRLMLFILYMIITFGIFGTVLMMTAERTREFGILLSIGMKRGQLAASLFLETLFLAANGIVAGAVAVFPVVLYFHYYPLRFSGDAQAAFEEFGFEPILPASLDPTIALTHGSIILLISAILALYPAYKIWRIKPVDALHS
jgi:putative ABC transport system permease protein